MENNSDKDLENELSPQQFSSPEYPNAQSGQQYFSINMSMGDLKSFTGWATFRAIIDIIAGAFSCLGIITAAYGVPMIMAGVKLLNAVDNMKRYMMENDAQNISLCYYNLLKYFKLNGISTIVKIGFSILIIIIYIILIAAIISNGGDTFFRDFSNYY
ncbi:hypothetical protein DFR58_10223 [Anaerobacterium chartisolvens]|uniref:Uncharacterized protein n=1 Tax=Anaerobacterium chartisolvens TaxID=1297424 RepID=A0A369BJT2_9FIRM|nr:DUF5362 family protein [Anaerobacterium chartisolvens]RCX19954.1 hypothetical protein DFR58_10223 [Anaerobacterium chartisolvens]